MTLNIIGKKIKKCGGGDAIATRLKRSMMFFSTNRTRTQIEYEKAKVKSF